MAELVSSYDEYNAQLSMRIRTRDAMGNWTWLIDGDTGLPVEATINDSWLHNLADPTGTLHAINGHMQRLTERASVLEYRHA